MEIVSIILSVPLLLLICWGLGGLVCLVVPDLEQTPLEQIVAGFIILILIGIMSKL